jgi:putative phosphoesterase
MRVVVTADVHADEAGEMRPGLLEELRDEVFASAPDVFIIAGDLVGLLKTWAPYALELLSPPKCLKLIVPGNHDLWLQQGDSYAYYKHILPEVYAACDYHMLDTGPRVVGNVAFVGNIGWYDYSLRDPALPPTPRKSYEKKTWHGQRMWMDGEYVHLGMSDAEFNQELLAELRKQLDSVPPDVETIIAVTHHLAFQEMVHRKPDDRVWNFCNAFLGSRALGELLLQYPRVRYHFCGHTHSSKQVVKGKLTSINVGSTYDRKRLEILRV